MRLIIMMLIMRMIIMMLIMRMIIMMLIVMLDHGNDHSDAEEDIAEGGGIYGKVARCQGRVGC